MEIEEIRAELEKRGWTQAELAEKLHKKPTYVRQVLSGNAPLTESTAAHIALLFESTRTAFLAFAVDIPEGTCAAWVPGFKDMTERQQKIAVGAVVEKAVALLAEKGRAAFTAEDIAAMHAVLPHAPQDLGPAPLIHTIRPAAGPVPDL